MKKALSEAKKKIRKLEDANDQLNKVHKPVLPKMFKPAKVKVHSAITMYAPHRYHYSIPLI